MIKKTSRSSAYYIDTFAQHSAHEMFNSSLMLMCTMVFESVKCNISRSSYSAFKNVIDVSVPSNLTFRRVSVVNGDGRISLILRYLFSSIQNIRHLVTSPKETVLIFPFNNLFSLRILNFLNKGLKRKIVIFCHGEMESLVNDLNGVGLLHRILAKLSRDFFLNPNVKISDGLYFSVMGDVLKRNLSEVIPQSKLLKFISIDHPYIFKDIVTKPESETKLFHVGTVGTFSKQKGLDQFITFVTRIDAAIRKHIKISVVGKILGDVSLLEKLDVEILHENKGLSRKDFNTRIQTLDLILFFYKKNSYKITASGAIFDAILHEKPILALKNDYFTYLFEKFGDFGYLQEDIGEMNDKLQELLTSQKTIKIDFDTLKEKLTPMMLSQQLAQELSRIGYLTL